MREGYVGVNPLQAVFRQRQRLEERRRDRHRVDGGADVVNEPGECQRRGAVPPPTRVGALDHEHALAASGQLDGRGQAVGPGADHDRVVLCCTEDSEFEGTPEMIRAETRIRRPP